MIPPWRRHSDTGNPRRPPAVWSSGWIGVASGRAWCNPRAGSRAPRAGGPWTGGAPPAAARTESARSWRTHRRRHLYIVFRAPVRWSCSPASWRIQKDLDHCEIFTATATSPLHVRLLNARCALVTFYLVVEKHLKPFYRAKNKMKTKNFETADLQFALVAFSEKVEALLLLLSADFGNNRKESILSDQHKKLYS